MTSIIVISLVMECFLVTTALKNNNVMFSGPKMCERLCQRTVGCSSFLYSTKYLSCQLQSTDVTLLDDSFRNISLTKVMEKLAKDAKLRCPILSEKFFNHKQSLQCRVSAPLRPSKGEKLEKRKDARLLVYQMDTRRNIKQVSLSNYDIHIMQYTFKAPIFSLVYVPPVKRICITTSRQLNLFMFDNCLKKISERIDTNVICITFDTKNIFYVKKYTSKYPLMKMSLYGKDKVFIKELYFCPDSIEADKYRLVLYAHTTHVIYKLTHRGEIIKFIRVDSGIMSLAAGGDVLYLSSTDSCEIYKFSVPDEKKELFNKCNFKSPISTLAVLRNEIHVLTKNCHIVSFLQNGSRDINIESKFEDCLGCLVIYD